MQSIALYGLLLENLTSSQPDPSPLSEAPLHHYSVLFHTMRYWSVMISVRKTFRFCNVSFKLLFVRASIMKKDNNKMISSPLDTGNTKLCSIEWASSECAACHVKGYIIFIIWDITGGTQLIIFYTVRGESVPCSIWSIRKIGQWEDGISKIWKRELPQTSFSFLECIGFSNQAITEC